MEARNPVGCCQGNFDNTKAKTILADWKRKKAVNNAAICITDVEVLEEMKRKKEEKEKAEEEKELRKIKREKKKDETEKKQEQEKKKQERAREKEQKAKEKERKAKEKKQTAKSRSTRSMKHSDVAEAVGGLSLDEDDEGDEDDEDDVMCPSCGLDYKDDESDRDWIFCDSCNQWFCFECSGKIEIPLESEPYYCCNCV